MDSHPFASLFARSVGARNLPAAGLEPLFESFRAAWRRGDGLSRLFGPLPFGIAEKVGGHAPNRRGDVATVESLLHRAGYYDLAPMDGPTGYYGSALGRAITRFQSDHGLKPDGSLHPDGETIRTLAAKVGTDHRPPEDGVVHVSGYTRAVDGKEVEVSPYDRAAPERYSSHPQLTENNNADKPPIPVAGSNTVFSGYATYYDLPGNKTASGVMLDANADTAAMFQKQGIKLGDTVRVHLQSDPSKYIDVKVNDSGPFLRDARGKAKIPLQPDPNVIIDLTRKAFEDLAGDKKLGKVKVYVTKKPDAAK